MLGTVEHECGMRAIRFLLKHTSVIRCVDTASSLKHVFYTGMNTPSCALASVSPSLCTQCVSSQSSTLHFSLTTVHPEHSIFKFDAVKSVRTFLTIGDFDAALPGHSSRSSGLTLIGLFHILNSHKHTSLGLD